MAVIAVLRRYVRDRLNPAAQLSRATGCFVPEAEVADFSPNDSNAASTDVDDDNCVALEGPVSGVNLTLEWIELDPDCMAGDH